MLACSQDIFFDTNESNNEDQFKDSHKRSDNRQLKHVNNQIYLPPQAQPNNKQQDNNKEEQQVWPPDVEAAFIKALETIPKLGRRKILVNGKPCGRNELISDFIFRKTSKIRTRKQVSSHIQVLKNTRKNDPHFMKLLTDTVEDEGFAASNTPTTTNTQPTITKKTKQSIARRQNKLIDCSSDESSMSSSPSSSEYALYQDQLNSMLDIKDPLYEPFLMTSNVNNQPQDVLQQILSMDPQNLVYQTSKKKIKKPKLNKKKSLIDNQLTNNEINTIWIDPSLFPLWPNYICLYLEYVLPYDPSITIPHTLAALPECIPNCIPTINNSLFDSTKCPAFIDLTSNPTVTSLLAKVKLNLNLNMTDFIFNNTSFFETQERRTIECTTTIYSFGNVVLESKEVQQALWINEGKFVYSFVFVNQFFDAFMKGIRSLQSWDEVDIAINNLCVVQVFEDIESKFIHQQPIDPNLTTDANDLLQQIDSTNIIIPEVSPLLVMVYEFERGQGTMDISIVNHP